MFLLLKLNRLLLMSDDVRAQFTSNVRSTLLEIASIDWLGAEEFE